MDIITILKDFFRCKSLQEFINNRYYNNDVFRINKKNFLKNIKYLITKEGLTFKNSHLFHNLIEDSYDLRDLKPDDIVLVLGACEGDCLVFADKVKHIIAVEPVHYKILKENIEMNNIKNVTVFEFGLGEGTADIEYDGKETIQAPLYSLTELVIRSNLRPSVLICDVQGYEHFITSQELKQFRIIEMESHVFGNHTLKEMRQKIIDARFDYSISDNHGVSEIIHARNIYAHT